MEISAKPILKMGNPLLREIASPVDDPTSDEIRTLVEVMKLSMKAAGGVGLAAPQIGVLKRVVIFEVPADRIAEEDGSISESGGVPQTVLINPILTPLSDQIELGWEGCLSVPGLRGLVPRYTHLRYEAVALQVNGQGDGVDLQGNTISRDVSGFHARVVQHEVDHLDGVLYPERMSDIRQLIFQSEISTYMESFSTQDEEAT